MSASEDTENNLASEDSVTRLRDSLEKDAENYANAHKKGV